MWDGKGNPSPPVLTECINYQGDEWCSTYVNKCVPRLQPKESAAMFQWTVASYFME